MTFQQDAKQEQTDESLGEEELWRGDERLLSSTVPWEGVRGTGRKVEGSDIAKVLSIPRYATR